jgi:threonine-phosphate decarboxylase
MIKRLHGANPEKLYKELGVEKTEKIIDFSTNTNVLKFEGDLEIDVLSIAASYPDDECDKLKEAIKENEGCNKEEIFVCNGTNEFIYLMASIIKKGAALLQPLYSEYERALLAYGVKTNDLFSIKEINHLKDIEVLFICNPNNPTGQNLAEDEIRNIVKVCYEKGIYVIIDEAYSFFLAKENNTNMLLREFDNVYIMKSLTKIYNLSGVRIGYVISSDKNIQKLKEIQPTWSVNGIAQELAYKYLINKKFLEDTKIFYANESKKFIDDIKEIGYEIMDSKSNFFLMKVFEDEKFIKYMLSKGIVVRHTRNFKTLSGKYVRIAVKTREQNEYFTEMLKCWRLTKN